jgi:hypothetical protein
MYDDVRMRLCDGGGKKLPFLKNELIGGLAILVLIFSWLCVDVREKSDQKLSKNSHMKFARYSIGDGNTRNAQMICQRILLAGGRYSHFRE